MCFCIPDALVKHLFRKTFESRAVDVNRGPRMAYAILSWRMQPEALAWLLAHAYAFHYVLCNSDTTPLLRCCLWKMPSKVASANGRTTITLANFCKTARGSGDIQGTTLMHAFAHHLVLSCLRSDKHTENSTSSTSGHSQAYSHVGSPGVHAPGPALILRQINRFKRTGCP